MRVENNTKVTLIMPLLHVVRVERVTKVTSKCFELALFV